MERLTQQKPEPKPPVVWALGETDDWDGIARVGMFHRDYVSVRVVLHEDPTGWWDGENLPYAVFLAEANVEQQRAVELVTDAVAAGTVQSGDPPSLPPQTRPADGYADVVIDLNTLSSAITAGMLYGKTYDTVALYQSADGQPFLRFGSDGSDSADDDAELSQLLDQL